MRFTTKHFVQNPIIALLLIATILSACSSSRYIKPMNLKENESVRLSTRENKIYEGLITQNSGNEIIIVSDSDHKPHILKLTEIRRVEYSQNNYDFLGYPISAAEIEQYKKNKNAWGYAVGGAAIGGLLGLLVALPFWASDAGGVPPYFTAGIGAIAGSIYFATKGIKKDKEISIETVRHFRERERQLEREKLEEEKKIEAIQKESEELKQKLEKNDDSK
jgi:hypothetical protein